MIGEIRLRCSAYADQQPRICRPADPPLFGPRRSFVCGFSGKGRCRWPPARARDLIRSCIVLVFLVCMPQIGRGQQGCQILSPTEASTRIGERHTVCGRAAVTSGKTSSGSQWLGLEDPDGRESLWIVAPTETGPLSKFTSKAVCVTGVLGANAPFPKIQVDDISRVLVFASVPVVVRDLPRVAVEPGVTTLPRKLAEVQPYYDRPNMKHGRVVLEAVILASGRVGDVRIVESLDCVNGADQEAVLALKKWVFSPATRQGVPVPIIIRAELEFPRR
jgi:TonB family protein